jgi:hypothetical protein
MNDFAWSSIYEECSSKKHFFPEFNGLEGTSEPQQCAYVSLSGAILLMCMRVGDSM